MNNFVLNEENLRKGWAGADAYWFSLRDYKVRDAVELSQMDTPEGMSHSSYFVSIGYIPYFMVTDEEVMRAYVASLTNVKLKSALDKIDDKNYVEGFWKYFNAYPQLAEGWEEFEQNYVLEKAKAWCEENAVNYTL